MEDDCTVNELAMILLSVRKKEYTEDAKYDYQYVVDSSDEHFLDMSASMQESDSNFEQEVASAASPIIGSVNNPSVIPIMQGSVAPYPVVGSNRTLFPEKMASPPSPSGITLADFTRLVCKQRRMRRMAIVKQRRVDGKIHIANSSPRYKLMQRSALKRERKNGRFAS